MNIEERAAQAAAWKATGQCNCAQAVLKTFEDKLPVDADTLMKLGAGYAAGMGCMESTCGALIGAVMVAGIVTDGKGAPQTGDESNLGLWGAVMAASLACAGAAAVIYKKRRA